VAVRRELEESLLFVKLQLDTGFHGSIYLTENGNGVGAKIKADQSDKMPESASILPPHALMFHHICDQAYYLLS
jgi:hypothetical protein